MFITWDLATKEGDYGCKIYWWKGKYGNVYIENVEYFDKKEVKKVKKDLNKLPYFETKVVKVKKAVCHHDEVVCKNGDFKCSHCGRYLERVWEKTIEGGRWSWGIKRKQPKGNWVDGENLDKIKFPCFCSYKNNNGVKRLCQINTEFLRGYKQYTLVTVDRQVGEDDNNTFVRYDNLKQLIQNYNLHILKGKIILFEEE